MKNLKRALLNSIIGGCIALLRSKKYCALCAIQSAEHIDCQQATHCAGHAPLECSQWDAAPLSEGECRRCMAAHRRLFSGGDRCKGNGMGRRVSARSKSETQNGRR